MREWPKECPMCGEFMRLVTRETVTRVPGTSQEVKTAGSRMDLSGV